MFNVQYPGEEGPGEGGHSRLGAELLEGEPESNAVDLRHAARHPPQLGLLVHLVAVSRVDALKLGSVPAKETKLTMVPILRIVSPDVSIDKVHHKPHIAVHCGGRICWLYLVKQVLRRKENKKI